jgi:Domain of unknown function (DUF4386)
VFLLLLPVVVLLGVLLSFAAGADADVFDRDQADDLLKSIHDSAGLYFFSVGVSIVGDVLALGVAAILYLLFKARSPLLALFALVGILGGAIGGFSADAADLTLGYLAGDFAEGGAGVPAGDPTILQTARTVGIAGVAAVEVAWMALGFALVSLGILVGWARPGGVDPPRWMGPWAIAAGIAWFLTWFAAVSDAAQIFLVVGLLGTELWIFVLGVWLLRKPSHARAATAG